MSDLDDTLRSILTRYRIDSKYEQFVDTTEQAVEQIKAAFAEAGWTPYKEVAHVTSYTLPTMSSQEWYDRFKREYHMRADWISEDPTMGADAEHDVLLAARLAANITEDTK